MNTTHPISDPIIVADPPMYYSNTFRGALYLLQPAAVTKNEYGIVSYDVDHPEAVRIGHWDTTYTLAQVGSGRRYHHAYFRALHIDADLPPSTLSRPVLGLGGNHARPLVPGSTHHLPPRLLCSSHSTNKYKGYGYSSNPVRAIKTPTPTPENPTPAGPQVDCQKCARLPRSVVDAPNNPFDPPHTSGSVSPVLY